MNHLCIYSVRCDAVHINLVNGDQPVQELLQGIQVALLSFPPLTQYVAAVADLLSYSVVECTSRKSTRINREYTASECGTLSDGTA